MDLERKPTLRRNTAAHMSSFKDLNGPEMLPHSQTNERQTYQAGFEAQLLMQLKGWRWRYKAKWTETFCAAEGKICR